MKDDKMIQHHQNMIKGFSFVFPKNA